MDKFDLLQLLPYISADDYEVWYQVGMALKDEGYSVQDWENWSRSSSKYHPGECEKKWDSFGNGTRRVTGATITMLAKEGGWEPKAPENDFLAWDAVIGSDKVKSIVDEGLIEKEPVPPAPAGKDWNPKEQLRTYLNVLFQPDDIVGYCVQSMQKDSDSKKMVPANSGIYIRTAGDLLKAIDAYADKDISYVIGDYNKKAGAWFRINPLDGHGVSNANVTDFRYALIESDEIPIEQQYSVIKQMKLPVAVLVHSGGKSLHAIVKINAFDMDDYSRKVQYLYDVCEKSGLKIDRKNKNPSRLSRMPGIERGGQKQYIVDTNLGCPNYEEWVKHVALIDNALPDPKDLSDLLKEPPVLAEEVIGGILRQGHKMLIAGASKAGKSFLLMELCVAISKGEMWLKWKCKQGRILYINLEIDESSCIYRFGQIVEAMNVGAPAKGTISIQSLRGMAAPLDKLVDRLIFKAKDDNYSVIIIDPIYKVITGDENSASDMAHFTNQFDKIAESLGCSVIYCHHHSKGAQGDKRVADRASGSGVFARDADALLDMVELEIPIEVRNKIINEKLCRFLLDYFRIHRGQNWSAGVPVEDLNNSEYLKRYADNWEERAAVVRLENRAKEEAEAITAWRIEGTLREFPRFAPVNLWFEYPIHRMDTEGLLTNALPIGSQNPHIKGGEASKRAMEEKRMSDDLRLVQCFSTLSATNEEVTQPMLIKAFNESREADGMRAQDPKTVSKKIAKSERLEKVNISTDNGKSQASIIRLKPEKINEDFPSDFWDSE